LRGIKEKDPHQFMPLLFGMPILAAFTYLNDTYLRPRCSASYDFAHETPFVAALRTADRASMLGAVSPFTNAMFGTKYTRSLSEAFMGSAWPGPASQMAEKMVVKPVQAAYNGTEGNGAERGAAGALYDMFIEPAVDAAAVAGVGGKVATGVGLCVRLAARVDLPAGPRGVH
jgi:hypothetical protein